MPAMRWAFWKKEPPPPPKRETKRHFVPLEPKRDTRSITKKDTQVPSPAPPPEPAPPPPPATPTPATPPAFETIPGESGSETISPRERLGEMLMKKGLISADALERALDVQRALRADTFLGEILVRERILSEEQLTSTISRQYKIPFLRIENYDIKKEVLELIPGHVARRLRAVPIDRLGRIVSVAMVNPLDEAGIAELQGLTNLKIKPIICLSTDMKKVLDLFYAEKKPSSIILRRGDTPPPFPSIVPPPPDGRVIPEGVTGRFVPPAIVDPNTRPLVPHSPGAVTKLYSASIPAVQPQPVAPTSAPPGEVTPAEAITEELFETIVNATPENLLRRGTPQGVRRKAIPAALIGDAEFALFVGALPRK